MTRVILVVALLAGGVALAHGGATDANGCHRNRKTGDFHCHERKAPQVRSGPKRAKVPRYRRPRSHRPVMINRPPAKTAGFSLESDPTPFEPASGSGPPGSQEAAEQLHMDLAPFRRDLHRILRELFRRSAEPPAGAPEGMGGTDSLQWHREVR